MVDPIDLIRKDAVRVFVHGIILTILKEDAFNVRYYLRERVILVKKLTLDIIAIGQMKR